MFVNEYFSHLRPRLALGPSVFFSLTDSTKTGTTSTDFKSLSVKTPLKIFSRLRREVTGTRCYHRDYDSATVCSGVIPMIFVWAGDISPVGGLREEIHITLSAV